MVVSNSVPRDHIGESVPGTGLYYLSEKNAELMFLSGEKTFMNVAWRAGGFKSTCLGASKKR